MDIYEVIFGVLVVVLLLSIRAKAAYIIEQNIEQTKSVATTGDEILRRIESTLHRLENQNKEVIGQARQLFDETKEMAQTEILELNTKLIKVECMLDSLIEETSSQREEVLKAIDRVLDDANEIREDIKKEIWERSSKQEEYLNDEINRVISHIN